MGTGKHSLFVLGASHHTAAIGVRERFAVPPERLPALYGRLKALSAVREAAVLNTCNRTEVYSVLNGEGSPERVERVFREFQELDEGLVRDNVFRLEEERAARHLFEVASGMDSLVVGEAEILGQVKNCYAEADRHGTVGPLLNRLFQKSFQAAKWVRTHTGIGRGQVSVGSVAADLAVKVFGNLKGCRILVVGAGEISERTIAALKGRGAGSLTIANRTDEKALELAQAFEGAALPYEQLSGSLPGFEIVICSTAAATPILGRGRLEQVMEQRGYEPLFVIDLGLPRDVDPDAGELDSLFLYNVDDLSGIAEENLRQREAEMKHCREVLEERARSFWERYGFGS